MNAHSLPVATELPLTSGRLLPIALAADAAYAMPLATTLRSIAESNRAAWPVEVHVIHEGIGVKTKRKILQSLPAGSVTIAWHVVDLSSFAGAYSSLPHISKMTYARLILPRLLPHMTGRMLYFDSDILVIGALDRLCHIDLRGAAVGAVIDPIDDGIRNDMPEVERVPRVARYFNAGILLIDLDRWRSDRIPQRMLQYLDQFPNSPFSDQDALNVACDGNWKELESEWNFQCKPKQDIRTCVPRPSIVHFVSTLKPWKPRSASVNASYYNAIRARTCFARTPWEWVSDETQRIGHRLLGRSALVRTSWTRAKRLLTRRTSTWQLPAKDS